MKSYVKFLFVLFLSSGLLSLTACSPEIGSEKWCEQLEEKSKADWTAREAKDYAKHCVIK
jgi:hypothetical protein